MSHGTIGISTAEQGRQSLFYATLFGLERPGTTVIAMARSAVISENRNTVTGEALRNGSDWVLYLDDDQVLPGDILKKLLASDVDVVSALYTQRQPPFNPVLMDYELPDGSFTYKQLSPNEKGLIKVAAAGAGCLLVKRKVLEALEPPYWTLGQLNPATWGDDLHFCSRVRKAGFDIYCNLDATIGHMMTGTVWPVNDPQRGWTATFSQDIVRGPITGWPMPLPGDGLGQ